MDKLTQLRTMTSVVADTGDVAAIKALAPVDATTNPSLILKASGDPQYQALIADAVHFAKGKANAADEQVTWAARQVAVNFGAAILKLIPGRVSTEVDASLSFDTYASIREAEILMDLYAKAGVSRHRVLIKLAATWEGIKAAEILEKQGIHCNLTLLFSFAQARACADAGVTLISPFVGRIYDWYKAREQRDYVGDEDPGVQSVKKIFNYYKAHAYPTIVMGASFRNLSEIEALAGCDCLTISPVLLDALSKEEGVLKQILNAQDLALLPEREPALSEAAFRMDHNQDAMATEKLAEGIRLFCKDVVSLKSVLQAAL